MSTLTELFSNSAAQRVGWALVHFLWQGAAVALVLAVLLALLRRRSAQARWALSCAALALLAVLPVATALTVSVEAPGRSGLAPTAGAAYSMMSTGVSVELPMGPASPPQPDFAQSPQPSQATPLPAQPAPTAPAEQIAAVSWHRQLQDAIQPALPWAILVWLAGVIVMSVWHFGGWLQVRRMRRLGTRPAGAVVQEMFDRVLQRLGVRRPVRLLESVRMAVPAAVGWLRPVVLLPVGAVTGLTPRQLEAILAHELAHIRRWDCLVQALAAVIETLLFYHPVVWWVCRQIRQESEQCCDDLAVGVCGDRRCYAHALAKVAELGAARSRASRRDAAFAAAATGGKLLPRIRRLLGAEMPGPLSLGRCLSGVLALLTIIAIAIAVGVSCSSEQAPHTALSNMSATQLATQPATQPGVSIGFGPVVERIVRAPSAKSDTFLDLEAGKLFAHDDSNGPNEPTMSKELSQIYRRARWAKGSGADLCLPPDGRFGKDVTGLVGLDMRMLPTNEPFDRLTPRDAAKALAGRDYYMLNDMQCAVGELPATFLVETREGHLGVVQVAGVRDNPPGLMVRYRMAPAPVDFGLEEPLWITLAPSEPTVKSLRELQVLAKVRSLNQEAGRSGEWEIRTTDNTRRVARLPYRWSIQPDQLLPDGKRILGGRNRKGRFDLDESQLRRVGAMEKGDYLLAWYVAGQRCSNVMAFRIDPACDPGTLSLLELAEIETGPDRGLPVLVLRARRHAEKNPAPLASDVAHATLNVDGRDRTLGSFLWTGPDGPLRVGDHYTYLLDLKWWTWDPKLKQAATPIDPNKTHVIFAKVGRDKVQQTPPIRLTYARTLGEAWDLATPILAPVSPPEASISLSGSVFDLQGKPGTNYEVTLAGGDGATFREKADAAGKYSFSRIPPGTYRLGCNPPAMGQPELAIGGIVIQAGKTTLKDVSLAGKFILAGRVTDGDGKPVPNMAVDLSCQDRQAGAEFMDTTQTDEQGRYRLASPLGTVTYVGVNGRRINGDMPRLSAGENAVDFPADKGHFRAESATQPAPTTQPATQPAEAAEIERLVKQLGSERFAKREEAQKALMEIGVPAAAALEKAAGDADTERGTRSKAILTAMRRETARLVLARKGRICAYLTAKAPDTGREAEKMALGDLEDLKLQEEPLLGDGDFTQYDAKGHRLRLTDKALAKFPKKVDVWGVPFVVVVDGRRWYMGSFYNPISSYMGPAPNTTIDLMSSKGDRGLATPRDKDPDPAILAVLQTLGGGATTTPASEPASPAAEIERLIKQLGGEKVAMREDAQKGLVTIGLPAVSLLQTAASDKNAELANRAQRALGEIAATWTAWGQVVDGLQAGLLIENGKRSWRIGDSFSIAFIVRNVGQKRLDVEYYKPYGLRQVPAPYGLRLLDADGHFAYYHLTSIHGGAQVKKASLAAGESLTLRSCKLTIWPPGIDRTPEPGTLMVEPGKYTLIQVDTTPNLHAYKPIRSTGGLTSGAVELEVLPARPDDPVAKALSTQPAQSCSKADIKAAMSVMGNYVQMGLDAVPMGEGFNAADWLSERRAIEKRCAMLSDGAVDFLGHIATARPDELSRKLASDLLGFCGKDRAIGFLLQAMMDESGEVRSTAARALECFRTPEVIRRLLQALKTDKVANVRASAAYALGHVGNQVITADLLEALKSEQDAHAMRAIFTALSWLKDKAAIPVLKEMRSRNSDPEFQQGIANTIRNIENPDFKGTVRQPSTQPAPSASSGQAADGPSTQPAAAMGSGQAPATGSGQAATGAADKARVVRRIYEVRDLVIAIPSYMLRPAYWDEFDPNGGFPRNREPGEAESRALQNKTIERENEAQLIEKIKRIDPGSWLPEAGIGSITPSQDGKNLVISQTPENHAQISKLIEMLRDERSLQVRISFKFIRLLDPPAAGKSDALPAWLSKNVKAAFDEKTGLLRMSDSEAEALLEHVKSKADYTLLAAPRMTLYNRQRAYVTVRHDEAIFLPRLDKKGEKALMQIPIGAVVDIQTVVDRKGKSIVCDLAPWLAERAFQADSPGVAVAEAKAAFTVPDKAAMLLRVEMVKHKIEGARQAVGPDGAAKMEIQHSPVETGGREKDFVYILISPQIIERAEAETQPAMVVPILKPPAPNGAGTEPAPSTSSGQAANGATTQPAGNAADNKAHVVRRVYEVRDLVIAIPSYAGPAYWDGIDGNMGFLRGTEPGSAESRALRKKTIERQNVAQLIEKIKRIDPGSWLPEAGIESILLYRDGEALVISQTPENHARISKFIELLRDERSLQVLISFKFIHWSGSQAAGKSDALPDWLSKNVKATFDEKTGLLRLSDSEAEALLEHVTSKEDYRLVAAPRMTLSNGQRSYVMVGTEEAIFLPRLDKNGEKALMHIPFGSTADIKPVVDRKGKSVVCNLATWLAERAFQGDVPGVAVAEAKTAFTVPDKAAMLLRVEVVKHKIEGARQAVGPDGAAKMEVQYSPVEAGKQEKDYVYILISPQIIENAKAETQPAPATRPADAPRDVHSAIRVEAAKVMLARAEAELALTKRRADKGQATNVELAEAKRGQGMAEIALKLASAEARGDQDEIGKLKLAAARMDSNYRDYILGIVKEAAKSGLATGQELDSATLDARLAELGVQLAKAGQAGDAVEQDLIRVQAAEVVLEHKKNLLARCEVARKQNAATDQEVERARSEVKLAELQLRDCQAGLAETQKRAKAVGAVADQARQVIGRVAQGAALQVGDEVEVFVQSDKPITARRKIAEDGTIGLPGLDKPVSAEGAPVQNLAGKLAAAYGLAAQPESPVSVIVTARNPKRLCLNMASGTVASGKAIPVNRGYSVGRDSPVPVFRVYNLRLDLEGDKFTTTYELSIGPSDSRFVLLLELFDDAGRLLLADESEYGLPGQVGQTPDLREVSGTSSGVAGKGLGKKLSKATKYALWLLPSKKAPATRPAPTGATTQPAAQSATSWPSLPLPPRPPAKDKAGGAKDEIARVYDIRDLIVPRQRYYPLVVGWLDSDAEKATEVRPAAPTAKQMREDLKDRIIKSVDKASWKEAGGQGAMKDLDYALVITQTAGNQEKITKVINDLRRERSRWMRVEAKVITASPDAAGRLEDWLKKSVQLTFQKGQPGIFLSAEDANSFLSKAQSFSDVQLTGLPRRYFFLSIVHGRTNTSTDTKGYRFELPDLNQPGKSDKVSYTAGTSIDIQGAISPDGNDITMTFTVSTAKLTREVMPVEAAAANAHATISVPEGHAFIAKAPLVQRQVKGFRRQKEPGSGELRTTVVEEPIPGRKPAGEVYVLIKPSIVGVQDVQKRDESEYVEEPRRQP